MPRTLFTACPAFGHLMPLLPLARAARAEGDAVLVSSAPALGSFVGDLPFRGLDPPAADLHAERQRRMPSGTVKRHRADLFGEMFGAVRIDLSFERLRGIAVDHDAELIVCDREDTVGPMVAASLGIHWARVLLGPELPDDVSSAIASRAAERYAGAGLAVIDPVAQLDPWPRSLQPPGWSPRPGRRAYGPGAALGDGRRSAARLERPSVLVSFGTMVTDTEVIVATAREVADRGFSVTVTAPIRRDGTEIPIDVGRAGIELVAFTPLSELLDAADAVVLAGGAGTFLACLARDLPIVVWPQVFDQFQVAELAAASGLAPQVDSPHSAASELARIIRDPDTAARRHAVAVELAQSPTPERAWALITAPLA